MDGDDYLFMSLSLFTHCCSEYIVYFLKYIKIIHHIHTRPHEMFIRKSGIP